MLQPASVPRFAKHRVKKFPLFVLIYGSSLAPIVSFSTADPVALFSLFIGDGDDDGDLGACS